MPKPSKKRTAPRTQPETLRGWQQIAAFLGEPTSVVQRWAICPVEKGQAQMKKPTIRVTKWLGDIPVEAGCSACPGVAFRAKGSGHRPNREEYQKSIQAQFDAHCKAVHS